MLNTGTGAASLQGEVAFSAVSRNGGPQELVSYPENELQRQLVSPRREGWTFDKWLDADGEELTAETIINGKHYYATWVDKVPPALALTCTKNTDVYQEVRMLAEDIASEIYGYYVGTENPEEGIAEYVENANGEYSVIVGEAGTYYFSVQDTCGNCSTERMDFIFVNFVVRDDEEAACDRILGKVGDTIALPDAYKKGHSLVGWIATETAEEDGVPVMEHTFAKEVSFEPVFEPKQYQIQLDGNGGTCETQMLPVIFGGNYPQLPEASRTGYHFLGWSKEANGELLAADAVYETDGDSTLFAKWEPIHYTVRYIGNGSTGGEMGSLECTYDVEFVHPRNTYVKDGYVFKGWSVSPGTISTQNALNARDRSYNGAEWLNEDTAMNITAEADAVINLYAVWQKIEVGVMDYRYCMGEYMYFACTTLNYKTENAADNGALFVGITPAGGVKSEYGANAIWATSGIRSNLNDLELNDMTGLKQTDTTVNYSYAGMMWEYNPYAESPCTLEDSGYGTKITAQGVANKLPTADYIFIPDLRDCYNYYSGNSWNWFWDMNLDGKADTYSLTGMHVWGPDDSYYTRINEIKANWRNMGWSDRYWLRNQYTGWGNYPFYISQYGVSSCNPKDPDYAAGYGNLAFTNKYLVRPMYTMKP